MKTDHLLFGAAYYSEYLPYDRVKESFDRIMDAFADSGIAVDDSVFTENPFDYY